ncbi:peptidyl-prolyl cis-trans isomerase FKBP43-like [Diospyros lotus]|uniref:peptidyl-prolyl cis-trans isomerase FKBP43-like n=1 Tax=Diospyros lotus TaxID=55363 RepID=UPI0022519161|nr:peptidyl-prolyl cis-trans isomerase FKBP43-like [Diospyros lotus]
MYIWGFDCHGGNVGEIRSSQPYASGSTFDLQAIPTMAFWGVEVRPGRPFTHSYNQVRGRLRISQATLGIGASAKKCLLQCNVGDKSPVLLCALIPEKTEYCHLDLEFEEADEVIFSVIGTRSVHLTGYFLGSSRHSNLDDNTESYGEDIGNTDSEKSTHSSKEGEYEDSFIDDSEPKVSPLSPWSDGRESDQEMLDKKKSKGRKGTRKRLKKKYQPIESDDNNSVQQNITNHCTVVLRVESEDEDNLPILSACKTVTPEAGCNIDMEIGEMSNKKSEDGYHPTSTPNSEANVVADGGVGRDMGLPCDSMLPPDAIGPENGLELNEEIANRPCEEKTLETYSVTGCDAINEDKLQHTEEKRDNEDLLGKNGDDQKSANDNPEICLALNKEIEEELQRTVEKTGNGYLLVKNGQDKKSTDDKESDPSNLSLCSADDVSLDIRKESNKRKQREEEGKTEEDLKEIGTLQDKAVNENPTNMKITVQLYDPLLSSTDAGSDNGLKPNKRRKESADYGKSLEGNTSNNNIPEEDSVKQNEGGAGQTIKDLDEKSETDQNTFDDKGVNLDPDQVGDGDQYESKKSRKKKNSKLHENEGNLDNDISSLSGKEKRSLVELKEKNVEDKSSHQSRTLPSGLVIEDLQMGKSDGKTASPGKKIKVHFIGKIRGNGPVFDSNIGKKPFRFRLGAEDIIDGWNVGIEGMRAGGKRRLIIPPSLGYGSEGAGESVPPNSWLEYEIELVAVR